MEDWTFPPAYNESYLPQAGSRYWFPQRETVLYGGKIAERFDRPVD